MANDDADARMEKPSRASGSVCARHGSLSGSDGDGWANVKVDGDVGMGIDDTTGVIADVAMGSATSVRLKEYESDACLVVSADSAERESGMRTDARVG